MSSPSRDDNGAIYNRPSLSSLAYRATTYAGSRSRMLDRLNNYSIPSGDNAGSHPLAQLTTRSSDDPVVALIDGWAAVADVVTFYQERIANEGFINTCTERRSLLELGRAIGYELGAGVAASTYLAFSVEPAAGSPLRVSLPIGTRVQSIPSQSGLPQTFETLEAIEARAEWNQLLPLLAQPQLLSLQKPGTALTSLYLQGLNTNLRSGDLLRLSSSVTAYVKRAQPDSLSGATRVDLLADVGLCLQDPFVLAPAQSSSFSSGLPLTQDNVQACILKYSWEEGQLATFLTAQGWDGGDLVRLMATIVAARSAGTGSGIDVKVYRQKVGFFGKYAPPWSSLPKLDPKYATSPDPYADPASSWDSTPARTIWLDSWGQLYKTAANSSVDFFLDGIVSGITPSSSVLLISADNDTAECTIQSAVDTTVVGYGQTARATGLILGGGAPASKADATQSPYVTRSSVAYVQSEPLTLTAMVPIAIVQPVTDRLTLDRMVLGLVAGRKVLVSGERSDAPGVVKSEIATLSQVFHQGGYTTLFFDPPLGSSYLRSSVSINANVALSGHGQTVTDEVLGSGDSSQKNQRFLLLRSPLTYLLPQNSITPQSTLSIRVNGITWQEVPSLLELDGRATAYMIQIAEDGRAQIVFGDGEHGARLPSGQNNVLGTYRTGSGLDGQVAAGSLQLLLSRPLGLRSVVNPLAADGASPPELLEQGRTRAPLQISTLDRVVTLSDYQSFAAAFPGIAKAQARSVIITGKPVVQLSLAALGGSALSDLTRGALQTALVQVGDPTQKVLLCDFRPAWFRVQAQLVVADQYQIALVLAAVTQALQQAFGFGPRDFGQPVEYAEVISVMQQVPGVTALLNGLYYDGPTPSWSEELQAQTAAGDGADPTSWLGAQILLLNLQPGDLVAVRNSDLKVGS